MSIKNLDKLSAVGSVHYAKRKNEDGTEEHAITVKPSKKGAAAGAAAGAAIGSAVPIVGTVVGGIVGGVAGFILGPSED